MLNRWKAHSTGSAAATYENTFPEEDTPMDEFLEDKYRDMVYDLCSYAGLEGEMREGSEIAQALSTFVSVCADEPYTVGRDKLIAECVRQVYDEIRRRKDFIMSSYRSARG